MPTTSTHAVTPPTTARRADLGTAGALAVAGVALVLYPVLRGSGAETGLDGAALWARDAWVAGHALGMLGFVAASWGLHRIDHAAGALAWSGTVLILPYYGAETFGLHALGQRALELGDPAMITAGDLFRYQPLAMTSFAAGLLLLAAAGGRLLLVLRHDTDVLKIGLMLTAAALLTYLPQFFLPMPARIGHGMILGLGLLVVAGSLATRRR